MSLEVVILAAGQGTRMRSSLPKVLHPIGGKPMLQHVLDTVDTLGADTTHVVIGHGGDQVKAAVSADNIAWVVQEQQLGTGHAVAQAMPGVADSATVLIAYGDVPLVSADTLNALLQAVDERSLALLTVHLDDPTGYGRIIRDASQAITRIVEQKDASETELAVQEVNTGILAVNAGHLKRWLPTLSSDNAQQEYYLTDIIAMAVAEGLSVVARHPADHWEVEGVNNRLQQSELERVYQRQLATQLMTDGVTLADPARLDIRGKVSAGKDVFIDVNCVFIGEVSLGDHVHIGPNCVIENSTVGSHTVIKSHCALDQSRVMEHCDIGPYARLRPATVLENGAKIGNFVETKKAVIGEGSKVNHLSYIGDSEVGRNVNVGAGTITCNYDGANKHKTTIGDNVFVGSNTALVAPVTIGAGATIGAGSTITHDVEGDQLSVARGRQRNIDNWQRPEKH